MGCGDGLITELFIKYKGLSASQVIGVDVVPASAPNQAFQYIQYDGKNLDRIPTASQDLITATMMLHHTDTPERTLSEIARVAAPGAMLVVREHDFPSSQYALLHDAVTILIEKVYNETIPMADMVSSDESFFSAAEWNTMIEKAGFKRTIFLPPSPQNPVNSFYAVYRKTDR